MWMKRDASQAVSRSFGNDFLASIVVFLVALPLCLGIAIAAGLPPASGLITGIIGGIIVGSLAGCPLQVSGPAAGLITLVWEIVQRHGVEGLGLIVLLAGILQLTAGLCKIGHWFRAVSPAVIQGMLSGIGILILSSQFHVMVDDTPKGSSMQNLLSIPGAIVKGLVPMDGASHHLAAAIGVMTILLILIWNTAPKKIRIIPGALIAVVCAVIFSSVLGMPIKYVSLPDNLLNVIQLPDTSAWRLIQDWHIWLSALSVAFIASAETMLTVTAVDRLHHGPRSNYNRELASQGIGNMICGFLGVLPMTGVIVRSATNVQAGARTRFSTMMHGCWILVLVVLFPHILRLIPTASLAAILVYTGYKLVNIKAARQLYKTGWGEFAIYCVTVGGILMTNLLEGVVIGLVLSALKLLFHFSRLEVRTFRETDTRCVTLYIQGSATFMNLPRLASVLESLPPGQTVNIRLEHLTFIDHACLELLVSWESRYITTGGSLNVAWDELHSVFNRPESSMRTGALV